MNTANQMFVAVDLPSMPVRVNFIDFSEMDVKLISPWKVEKKISLNTRDKLWKRAGRHVNRPDLQLKHEQRLVFSF